MSGRISLNPVPFPIGRQSSSHRLINGAIPITDFTYELFIAGVENNRNTSEMGYLWGHRLLLLVEPEPRLPPKQYHTVPGTVEVMGYRHQTQEGVWVVKRIPATAHTRLTASTKDAIQLVDVPCE